MSGSENDETASESDFRTDEATEVVSASTRAPINMLSIQKNNGGAPGNVSVSVAEVEIELTEDLKKKLVNDLSSICSVDDVTARKMLNENRWNMQRCIDGFFDASDIESDNGGNDDSVMVVSDDEESHKSKTDQSEVVTLDDVTSPSSDCKKEKETEIEKTSASVASVSSWAPEKISILSWNIDGLDETNIDKRTEAVLQLVLKEDHDILFFQELRPWTFDYLARRLCAKYMPIPGTEDPDCMYLTGTFVKKNHIHFEDKYIIPYPGTTMGRNILVTRCFIGQAKLALLNTHLESGKEYSDERKRQLRQCFELLKSFPPEFNVIFGGDLNVRDKEVDWQVPKDTSDLWIRCGSRATCQYTWDLTRNTNKQFSAKFQPRLRFDRFYFRPSKPSTMEPEFFGVTGLEKVAGTQSFPSDHWAIIAFFQLSKEARKPSAKKRKSEDASAP